MKLYYNKFESMLDYSTLRDVLIKLIKTDYFGKSLESQKLHEVQTLKFFSDESGLYEEIR